MPASTQPRKRYWLRGGLIGVAVQAVILPVSILLMLWVASEYCCPFPEDDRFWIVGPLIAYTAPNNISPLWSFIPRDLIDPLAWLLYFAASFGIGAGIGTWYGRRRLPPIPLRRG